MSISITLERNGADGEMIEIWSSPHWKRRQLHPRSLWAVFHIDMIEDREILEAIKAQGFADCQIELDEDQ